MTLPMVSVLKNGQKWNNWNVARRDSFRASHHRTSTGKHGYFQSREDVT
ncbi:hypothetical protein IMZ31_20500 (plasmid) [Pontibacillus sp. ALD_SL1]|nr:hypothetical protein [Pontibacillus sp. ALD_SL1]QST02931.1 hypothetical protein IMZ31_20500 [Pontibacillus sp. ALD_SL1]